MPDNIQATKQHVIALFGQYVGFLMFIVQTLFPQTSIFLDPSRTLYVNRNLHSFTVAFVWNMQMTAGE